MHHKTPRMRIAILLGSTALATAQTYQQAPPEQPVAVVPSAEWISRIERLAPAEATVVPAKPRAVLLFSLTTGFQHSVRPYATEIIKVLATKTKAFTVVESMDIECFSPENLAKFDAVILNNCCPDAKHRDLFLDVLTNAVDKSIKDIGLKYKDLTDGQRRQMAAELEKNLIDFVAGGKGLVSIHGSIAFQNNSAAFGEMMGASFDFHPKRQMLTLNLVDPAHPLVAAFKGNGFIHSDELYMFKNAYSKLNFRPLLEADMGKLDEASRNNPKITGKQHLYVSWIKRHGKGRVFYVSPSHQPQSYENGCMLKFHLDGIQYALGDLPCDDSPVREQAVAVVDFPLATPTAQADVFVAADDWKVAQIAARDLTADVERVTGRKPALKQTTDGLTENAVLVGTLGKSPVIDRLVKDGRLDVQDVRGQWESYVMATVADPMPGVRRALVIAGSDRRGTAYGVYELSKRIGVSPWYWWADVTPAHRESLNISAERVRVGPPAVKYRGIFINDEMWGIRPWAMKTLAPQEGHGLGPTTYARIFELLLRLKANHLWPAMHDGDGGTIPFNCYERNKVVADEYAIVMGSSHIEPMLRNNIRGAEWDREYPGEPWDYVTNKDHIYKYWEDRIKANGKYENVYTMGKRGKDDEAGSDVTVPVLERIMADQRTILGQWVDKDLTRVPQVLIAYTEVLGLYNKGLKVPDDMIFCWPDDNFGYIRQLPAARERQRSGGSGVYYHIQWLNGATNAYPWLNTTPPALIWEEMSKAWQYGAKQLWVLNVGDIKPGEIGTEFFLDMAWDPQRYRHDNVRDFLVRWAARDLDPRFAEEIASIMEEYYRLGFTRRPEHLVQARGRNPLEYSWFSHTQSNDEAMQRADQYDAIARRAQVIYDQLPTARKDAFFQLVLYPVQCASLINRKVIFADKSTRYGKEGRASASDYAAKARDAAARIIELTHQYNTGLVTAGAKWNHMISPAPGPWGAQFRQFDMPPLSDCAGTGPPAMGMALEGGDPLTLADLSVYTQGKRFVDLYNTGKGEIRWSATPSQPWVQLDLTSGAFATEQRLWVSIDWSRAPTGDDLSANIEVTSNAGNKSITVPVFKPAAPARDAVTGFVESHGCVSMEGEHFTRKHDRGGAAWEVIKGLGRSGDSVAVLPPTVASRTEPAEILSSSPSLDYDIYLFHSGEARLDIDCLPTKPVAPDRGVRLAVSLDGAAPQILTGKGGDVLANLRRLTTTVKIIASPGRHTLTVWMVDPGVVLDKLVLDFNPPKDSYLGPPESYRR